MKTLALIQIFLCILIFESVLVAKKKLPPSRKITKIHYTSQLKLDGISSNSGNV